MNLLVSILYLNSFANSINVRYITFGSSGMCTIREKYGDIFVIMWMAILRSDLKY